MAHKICFEKHDFLLLGLCASKLSPNDLEESGCPVETVGNHIMTAEANRFRRHKTLPILRGSERRKSFKKPPSK